MVTNVLLTPEIQLGYDRKLLTRFRTSTIFNKFGSQKEIGEHEGVALNWRRMEIIRPVAVASAWVASAEFSSGWPQDATYTSASAALLTEGTFFTPNVVGTWISVTATVQQYGQAAYISEWLNHQALDPQVPEYVENFGEAMHELLDLVTRDVLLAGTNIQYANGKGSQSLILSGDFISLTEFRKAIRTLKKLNAKAAEGDKFPAIVHPDTMFDLQGDSNITNVWVQGGGLGKESDYFSPSFKDLPFGIRLYESTIAPITRASGYTDYYNTFVLGKEAYGTLKVSSLPAKVIVHAPGSSGVSDPLDQVGTVGWKANFVAVILNQNNMVRIVHQTSAFTGTRAAL